MEKDAALQDYVLKLLKPNQGPMENLFRLLSNVPAFFMGLGGIGFTLLDWLTSTFFGVGMQPFGAWLDRKFGLGKDTTPKQVERLYLPVSDIAEMRLAAMKNNGEIVKVSSLGGILKMMGGVGKVVKMVFSFIAKAFAYLLAMYGVANWGELTEKIESGVKEKVQEMVREQVPGMLFGNQTMGDVTDLLGAFERENRS